MDWSLGLGLDRWGNQEACAQGCDCGQVCLVKRRLMAGCLGIVCGAAVSPERLWQHSCGCSCWAVEGSDGNTT